MADGLKIDVKGADEVARFIRRMPETLFDRAKKYFSKAVTDAHDEVQQNLKGNPLNTRTGALARSIKPEVNGDNLKTLMASIYSARKEGGKEIVYAPVHEFGATGGNAIKAKKAYARLPGGPYLNIPARDNKTPVGVQRMTARQVFMQGGNIARFKSGKFGVFLGDQIMFTLHKQVEIPARLGMRAAAENQIPTLLSNLQNMGLE